MISDTRELYEPQRQKTYLRTCASSEESNQPAHLHSLIGILTGLISDNQGCKVNQDSNETVRMDADAQANLSLCWAHVKRYVFLRCDSYSILLLLHCTVFNSENSHRLDINPNLSQ